MTILRSKAFTRFMLALALAALVLHGATAGLQVLAGLAG